MITFDGFCILNFFIFMISLQTLIALRNPFNKSYNRVGFLKECHLRSFCRSSNQDENEMIAQTKSWVVHWIIKNGFCPWAAEVYNNKQLKFRVIKRHILKSKLANDVIEEVRYIADKNNEERSSIVILPSSFSDFETFLDFHFNIERRLIKEGLNKIVQIATFHPDYRFENTTDEDVENMTNFAPYPIFHLLLVQDVSNAIESVDGNTNVIWERNIDLLRKKGKEKSLQLYDKSLRSSVPK
jgi:hypothetical protein